MVTIHQACHSIASFQLSSYNLISTCAYDCIVIIAAVVTVCILSGPMASAAIGSPRQSTPLCWVI